MKRVILITGASRGIGAATARLAAERGFAVGVNYREDEAGARAVVEEIKRAGGEAAALKADLGQEAEVQALFEALDRQLGRLSALVNNAARLEHQAPLEAIDGDRVRRIFAANVFGPFACCREAARRLSTKHGGPGGAIVNISSAAARLGSPGEYIDYAASKGALETLTIGLAKEVAEEGIRVNGVRPGHIYTSMHAAGGEPGRVDRVKASVPMKRGGQPDEVARAILWLLSDEASYVTGTILDVTGGR